MAAKITSVVCVGNDGYPASLEVGKLYPMLPDGEPDLNLVRVIDESGEDYLFPAGYFEPVTLSTAAMLALWPELTRNS